MTLPSKAHISVSKYILLLFVAFCLVAKGLSFVQAFASAPSVGCRQGSFITICTCNVSPSQVVTALQAKGFGGGSSGDGFGKSSSKKKKSTKNVKRAQQQLLDQYGGDVARGTQERINNAMKAQPEHVQLAAELYKKVQKWDAHMAKLSVLEQTKIPAQDTEGARRAKEQLQQLYEKYPDELSPRLLHNLFQRVTWDASADAKAARALMGNMKADLEERVDAACAIVAGAVKASQNGKCLDVGCGPGTLVPNLVNAGVLPKQIYGIDLSPEMIRNAQRTHRGVNFVAADFFEPFDGDEDGFDGILFSSSLHDLPDQQAALERAASLLRPGGKLVLVHAQGAAHVAGQHKANPIMVKAKLPTAQGLKDMDLGLRLEQEPADDTTNEGYLAVLSKKVS